LREVYVPCMNSILAANEADSRCFEWRFDAVVVSRTRWVARAGDAIGRQDSA
jgi:hypothetical protein